jgi:hypothetical protein
MRNSKKSTPCGVYRQTCFARDLQRLPIPVATELLCMGLISAILQTRQPLSVAATML